ncbi:MAG: YicC family protein [Deferribacterales bacterium]
MIKSMTGYSKVSEHYEGFSLKAEIKSLNSKYADVRIKLPKWFSYLEIKILNFLKEKLDRGKIDLNIEIYYNKSPKIPKVNNDILSEIVNLLKGIKVEHHIHDEIKIEHLLHFENVLSFEDDEMFSKVIEEKIIGITNKVILELNKMRSFEGERLALNLDGKLNILKSIIIEIEKLKDNTTTELFERIKKRMEELFNGNFEKDRLYQEAAILAEKFDIDEEVTRIRSHIEHFYNIMNTEDVVGKKLDFLCQEFYREFNTIGSKTTNSKITKYVIEGKNIVEQIREQVQNIV